MPKAVVLGSPAGMWLVSPLHFPLVPGSVVVRSIPAQEDWGAPCAEAHRGARGCSPICYAPADAPTRSPKAAPRTAASYVVASVEAAWPISLITTWAHSTTSSALWPGVPCE